MKANPIVGQGTLLRAWQGSARVAGLPEVNVAQLVPEGCRAVIIAPHPDDEVLGCGGLLQGLAALGRELLLISVTDGCASHPGSPRWPQQRLREVRPQESAEALQRLGWHQQRLTWLRGGFSDSQVQARESALTEFIQRHLQPDDVVFTTWREDGHCDHEAVGRASAQAALAVGARLIELPVWTWHWATPEDPRVPWQRARKIALAPAAVARKRHALHAFTSQLEGDPQIDLPPVLPPHVLERLLQPFEVVFV
ncbi:PIG-L family deacetylase [Pseudomonas sp. MF6772]|uniref:PIG-L deacetylase family protein n=1 Tax=Pseudomonas TaxID=286 RepID=UPI001472B37D|nr:MULTISPECIES: PIG-L family deacetylase [Pseudomonas]MBJ2267309.1 PIG-L family deacetylase [Pseudomonas sp. MF6772]MBL7226993.1 PIG-L family deacetylase [Pseudomonas sp.]MCU0209018.1 PIG-L family deacetylase [Pseudomonas shahriarae]NMY18878.1 PIG-L family deacetylase [Pseudomonas sp. WS 5410]